MSSLNAAVHRRWVVGRAVCCVLRGDSCLSLSRSKLTALTCQSPALVSAQRDLLWKTYSTAKDGKASNNLADNPLYKAVRAHGNFAENVPLAFTFAAIAELNGARPACLSCALGALFVFRVLHVEFGLYGPNAVGNGRPIGFLGTTGTIIGLAAYAGRLTYRFWK